METACGITKCIAPDKCSSLISLFQRVTTWKIILHIFKSYAGPEIKSAIDQCFTEIRMVRCHFVMRGMMGVGDIRQAHRSDTLRQYQNGCSHKAW